jgi:hypothetical protein
MSEEIKSRSYSQEGRKNHDRIFAKKTIPEWAKDEENRVVDMERWEWNEGFCFDKPISYYEFQQRVSRFTKSVIKI